MSQQAIRSPFAKTNLTYVDRIDPGSRLYLRNLLQRKRAPLQNRPATWRITSHNPCESLSNLSQKGCVEASAYTSCIHQLAIHIVGELQSTEVRATLLRRGVSHDYKIIGLLSLDLEPLIRPALPISRISFLRDDSLEPHPGDAFHESFT